MEMGLKVCLVLNNLLVIKLLPNNASASRNFTNDVILTVVTSIQNTLFQLVG